MADFNDFVDIAFKGGMTNEALYRGLARITPLPPPTPTEAASLMFEAPLTDMEEGEAEEGEFGAEPLEVRDGIAVTEEAVGLHVADLITQV
jgi:hypothetical protein